MSTSAQTGGLEHWLAEEMKLWHTLPIFVGLALLGWGFAAGVGLFIETPADLSMRMIGGAALFSGVLMGWHARRYKESGKLE